MTDYPIPPCPDGVDPSAWASTVERAREFCGWHIAPEITETVTLDGSGTSVQLLPTLRLTYLDSITNDGTAVTDPEWSAAGMVRGYCWTHKYRGVTATMTHGFEVWPYELEKVVVELASASAVPVGVKAVTSGSHQVTFESSLRSDQRATLDRYRLRDLP